jgi:hypothetical protein
MKPAKKIQRSARDDRELSESELNDIMRSMGNAVRAQTIEQKKRLIVEIKKEIEAVRTAFANHAENRSKA